MKKLMLASLLAMLCGATAQAVKLDISNASNYLAKIFVVKTDDTVDPPVILAPNTPTTYETIMYNAKKLKKIVISLFDEQDIRFGFFSIGSQNSLLSEFSQLQIDDYGVSGVVEVVEEVEKSKGSKGGKK